MTDQVAPIIHEALEVDGIKHGFFTRAGGVSKGDYAGLNVGLGSDDDHDSIIENRKRVADHLGVAANHLLSPYQVHSSDALVVEAPWSTTNGDETRPKLDALVTNKSDLAIGVLSADCGPVLFCDRENRVIGAAHAGWKGAVTGVLEDTIEKMEKLGAKRDAISAALGPTISAKHYEVGPEFVDRLLALSPDNQKFFATSTRADHAMFDLPAYILERLHKAGVNGHWSGHCTYQDEDQFFSYRRKTHRGEPDYGRQISAIVITQE